MVSYKNKVGGVMQRSTLQMRINMPKISRIVQLAGLAVIIANVNPYYRLDDLPISLGSSSSAGLAGSDISCFLNLI